MKYVTASVSGSEIPMTSARFLIALLLAVTTLPVTAQWTANGEAVPDEPWRRSSGTFGGMLLITTDVNKLYDEWAKPDPPNVTFTNSAERNVPVSAVVFFTGCKSVKGNCRVEVDFTVLR